MSEDQTFTDDRGIKLSIGAGTITVSERHHHIRFVPPQDQVASIIEALAKEFLPDGNVSHPDGGELTLTLRAAKLPTDVGSVINIIDAYMDDAYQVTNKRATLDQWGDWLTTDDNDKEVAVSPQYIRSWMRANY